VINAVSDPVAPSTTVTSEAITFDVASEWSKMMGGSTWTAPAGKTFKYWLANDMNLTQYYPGDAIPLDGSITMLTAIYEDSSASNAFSLTYEVGEGTGDNAVSDPVIPSTTVTSAALTFDEVSNWSKMMGGSTWTAPAGKTFSYWLANDINLTKYYPGDAIPLDGSVTVLYAFYEDAASSSESESSNTSSSSVESQSSSSTSSSGSQIVSSATSSAPEEKSSSTVVNETVPLTGDSTNTVIWVVLMSLSACGFIVILLTSKKKIR
jgi:hypothetical protein